MAHEDSNQVMKTIATTIAITLATTCFAAPPAATEKALTLKVVADEEPSGQGGPGMTKRWNELIRTLPLVRLGQELGQGGPLAVAVRDFLDGLFQVIR